MAIDVTCPGCGADYNVPETLAGKRIKCKSCGGPVAVAGSAPPAKAVVARPVTPRPVKAAPAVVDDEDDFDDDVRPARRGRPVEVSPARKSKLPLVLGILVALGLLMGIVGGGVYFSGMLDDEKAKGNDVAFNNAGRPTVPAPAQGDDTDPTESGDAKPTQSNTTGDEAVPKPSGSAKTEPPGKNPILPTTMKPLKLVPGLDKSPSEPRTTVDQLALDRAKNAAVYIEIETNDGGASGSGWFGIEPNLIITNAHVMNMTAPNAPKPKKITVWINPGTNKERVIPHAHLEILAIDRFADLAVLRVLNESDLPTPLQIRPSQTIRDIEPLIIIGYPAGRLISRMSGSTRAPQATVNLTNFSTNRFDDDGNIKYVQTRGGAYKGNSGGPIVDYNGLVSTMVVAGPAQAELAAIINYGVPTEQVVGLLAGRIADMEFGQAYRKSGKIHVPVKAQVLDPFQRLKEVRVGHWVGDKSTKTRPPGAERTGMEPSDTGFAETKLDYKWSKDKQFATGELIYPELQDNRAYWAQPVYSNAINDSYWMPGHTVKLSGPPVDLEDADLIARLKYGTRRPTTLEQKGFLQEFDADARREPDESELLQTVVKATETVQRTKDQGSQWELLLNYQSLDWKAANIRGEREDVLNKIMPKEARDALSRDIKTVFGVGYVRPDGSISRTTSDLRGSPAFAAIFKQFSDQAMQALEGASVPLPNVRVKPNHTWKDQKNVRFTVGYLAAAAEGSTPPPSAPGGGRPRQAVKIKEYRYVEEINYIYLGTRTRLGSKEAVLKVDGVIKPAPGTSAQGGASGSIKGYAYIDIDTGTVLESELKKEFEMDSSSDGARKVIAGSNTFKVTRGPVQ